MKNLHNEQGQSVVLIALGLAVLMAFMALAVDGGNVYAQRRQIQNAVDSASSAAGERLARHDPSSNGRATNGQVFSLVKKYLKDNGVVVDGSGANAYNLSVRYVTRDSANATHIDGSEITSYGSGAAAPLKIPQVTGDPVVGVYIQVDKRFESFFANVIGIRTMAVGANSPGYGAPIINCAPPCNGQPPPETTGACCSDEVFPLAINQDTFQDLDGDGNLDITFEESSPTSLVTIWQRSATAPNFVYVRWKNQDNSASTLASNMGDLSRSGTWYVQEYIPPSTGTMATSAVYNALNARRTANLPVTVPVYDATRSSGGETQYRIVGFARLQIVGVCRPGSLAGTCTVSGATQPYIMGKFEQWASSRCEGSCSFFGVRTNKPHDELPMERALIGVVKLNVHTLTNISFTQTPVDVVHVMDVSGSMNDCISQPGSGCANTNPNQKLRMAKNALITFNGLTQPNLVNANAGDKLGLATYPSTSGTNSYSMPCGGNYNVLMAGQNRRNLTNVITPTNTSGTLNNIIEGLSAASGTPIAGGMLVGRQMVLDTSNNRHVVGHQPVLILASDGLANVKSNGRWTGYVGDRYEDLPCNSEAVQDAIAEANLAKADNNNDGKPDVIIFTIAIGTDFNPYVLESIASEPSSAHHFVAGSAANMQNIYSQIAQVLQTGDCTASDHEEFAANAAVRVRNTSTGTVYNTTTNSTGYFEIRNVPPGTYEFESVSVTISGLTYDLFTNGVGGPILQDNPTIEVGDAPTSYDVNLALETDDFAGSCP